MDHTRKKMAAPRNPRPPDVRPCSDLLLGAVRRHAHGAVVTHAGAVAVTASALRRGVSRRIAWRGAVHASRGAGGVLRDGRRVRRAGPLAHGAVGRSPAGAVLSNRSG